MAKVLWQCVWEVIWVKLLGILGAVTMIWGLLLTFSPYVESRVPSSIKVDSRIWFGITIVILGFLLYRALRIANEYRLKGESEDNIRIVYNEANYAFCREVADDREIVRVGYRVIGKQDITNPVVLASKLSRDDKRRSVAIPVAPIPLNALVKLDTIHHSYSPSYWVDVFRHVLNTPIIEFCYNEYQSSPVVLEVGRYRLDLEAQGTGSRSSFGTLIITIKSNFSLDLDIEGKDQWSK